MKRCVELITLAGCLVLVGCSLNPRGEIPTVGGQAQVRTLFGDPETISIQYNKVVIVDTALNGKIAIENHGARKTPTGTIEVYATLRNRTDFEQQVEARVQFFDEQKVPIEAPSQWQRVILAPKTVGAYKELSIHEQIAGFYYVELRSGR